MKTLYLMRHGEAAAGSPSGRDHDRPLTERGFAETEQTAAFLLQNNAAFDIALCSDATRTVETATHLLSHFPSAPALTPRTDLYLADPAALFSAISRLDPKINTVLIVAHNPGLPEMLQQATDSFGNLPEVQQGFNTGTVIGLAYEAEDWSCVLTGAGHIVHVFSPV